MVENSSKIRFFDLLWLFLGGSALGFLIEGLWSWYRFGAWMDHSALVWGPLCIVYGLGVVMMYLISKYTEKIPLVLRFLLFAVTGAVLELICGLAQTLVFGSRSWDYGGHFWGYINLEMTVFWGILGTLFYYLLYPLLKRAVGVLDGRAWKVVSGVALVWLVANFAMTSLAVWRWGARINDQPASNGLDSYLDIHYDNARMERTYPNMEFRAFGE